MPIRYITNVEFIATLIHLSPMSLTYTNILELLQHWRHKPKYKVQHYAVREGTKITIRHVGTRRSFYGTQYLSYSPFRGGIYKKVLWDNTLTYDRSYYLLPRGKNTVLKGINSVDELFWYTRHKSLMPKHMKKAGK